MSLEKKMNPELKKRWIDALRSGEYKQGTMRLSTRDPKTQEVTHCCLGVLCDLNKIEGRWDAGDHPESGLLETKTYDFERDVSEGMIPSGVYPELDQLSTRPGPTIVAVRMHLAEMNDEGKSFAEIADWIEENL